MKKNFYITTPIYYPSSKAHIGHSYCSVATDAIARYKRLQGYNVMFLTGTDEHGQKIENNAKVEGVSPKAYVDKIVEEFKELWKYMDISYDHYIRTTDDYHIKAVQKIFRDLHNKGEIYKGKYEGWYCTPCETFWTESQLTEDHHCLDCHRDVEKAEEEAYFFKLSKYADKLLNLYQEQPNFLVPEYRKNEMIKFIEKGLNDLCVSRTSFTWGIPVDFDPKHVVYVWLDALSNYITALGYNSNNTADFDKYWPANVHIVGKEIMRFHAIIWPALLMALELPLPKQIFGHGWLLFEDGSKISKSKGNIVDPFILCDRYGVDAIRYFLLRGFPFGSDGLFSNEILIGQINADLANDLGNLLSRTTSMVEKYFAGVIPSDREEEPLDQELIKTALDIKEKYEKHMEQYQFSLAIGEVWKLIARANKYIDDTSPWLLEKEGTKKARLATVLYNLCEMLRIVSVYIAPFMPNTSPKIQDQIAANPDILNYESLSTWGLLPTDVTIQKRETLFPRIDLAKEFAELDALSKISKKGKNLERKTVQIESLSQIELDDFAKVDLRVTTIKACEAVPKTKKLLKLELDDGKTGRTVVSGIAPWYKPEELVGRSVILVANLKPATFRGIESHGMILAANEEKDVFVIFVDGLTPGSKIW